jgi:hypothetical protein
MRGLRIALGILNLIAYGSLVWYDYVWLLGSTSDAFTWGLPIFVAAIMALICGIFTLKGKGWVWAFAGSTFAVVGWIYFCMISLMFSFM